MTRMKYLVAAATLSLFLAGCSGSKEEVPDNPPNEIYATAQQKLQDGNWKQAITLCHLLRLPSIVLFVLTRHTLTLIMSCICVA